MRLSDKPDCTELAKKHCNQSQNYQRDPCYLISWWVKNSGNRKTRVVVIDHCCNFLTLILTKQQHLWHQLLYSWSLYRCTASLNWNFHPLCSAWLLKMDQAGREPGTVNRNKSFFTNWEKIWLLYFTQKNVSPSLSISQHLMVLFWIRGEIWAGQNTKKDENVMVVESTQNSWLWMRWWRFPRKMEEPHIFWPKQQMCLEMPNNLYLEAITISITADVFTRDKTWQ